MYLKKCTGGNFTFYTLKTSQYIYKLRIKMYIKVKEPKVIARKKSILKFC